MPLHLAVLADEAVDGHREWFERLAAREDEREREAVPGVDERDDGQCRQARCRQGERDAPEGAERRAAVDQRRLLQLARDPVEVALHHPGAERDDPEREQEDQADAGVVEAVGRIHEVEGHELRDPRHEVRHHERQEERAVAGEAIAREGEPPSEVTTRARPTVPSP